MAQIPWCTSVQNLVSKLRLLIPVEDTDVWRNLEALNSSEEFPKVCCEKVLNVVVEIDPASLACA